MDDFPLTQLELREQFDAIMGQAQAIVLPDDSPAELLRGAEQIGDLLGQATAVIARVGGSPTMVAIVKFAMVEVNITLGRALEDHNQFDQALKRCDEALAQLASLPEADKAPLLELRGQYLRGGILAARSEVGPALAHIRDVVGRLSPHVAFLQSVRQSGSEANVFAIEVLDRYVHAEIMLEDARVLQRELERAAVVIGAVESRLERVLVDISLDQRDDPVRPQPPRDHRLVMMAGMGAVGLGCFVIASYLGTGLPFITLWLVGGLIVLGALGGLKEIVFGR